MFFYPSPEVMLVIFEKMEDVPYFEEIKILLKQRGLKPVDDQNWEKHGPHSTDMRDMYVLGRGKWVVGPGKGVINDVTIDLKINRVYEGSQNFKDSDLIPILKK
jgi:hypothetical protein